MWELRAGIAIVVCVVACGGSSPPPATRAQLSPAPLEPTCLVAGQRFAAWLEGEVGDVQPIPKPRVTDSIQSACASDQWSLEARRCMTTAGTHDDWERCFADVSNPPPLPPRRPPMSVPPTLLEGRRIRGSPTIIPDDDTRTAFLNSSKDRIIGTFKLCLDTKGEVTSIIQLKTTGFPAYDAKIQREMQDWRYSPYMVNGQAVPVCTAITFIYS